MIGKPLTAFSPSVYPPGVRDLYDMGGNVFRFGSRETCDPAPTDTDEDWAVLLPNIPILLKAVVWLKDNGWECGGSNVPKSEFLAFRKDYLNIVVTNSFSFWNRYKIATEICKELNLMKKEDRIMVFSKVMNRI